MRIALLAMALNNPAGGRSPLGCHPCPRGQNPASQQHAETGEDHARNGRGVGPFAENGDGKQCRPNGNQRSESRSLRSSQAPDSFAVGYERYEVGQHALQYRLNRQQLSKIGLGRMAETVTIGLIGRNLFTITGYSGFDPEVGSVLERRDTFAFPNPRTLTFNFEIAF